ncbi:MAG: hypothetical protein ACI8O8_000005 [Oleiphilaceae bacterium]|jgi:hypothetical protein
MFLFIDELNSLHIKAITNDNTKVNPYIDYDSILIRMWV